MNKIPFYIIEKVINNFCKKYKTIKIRKAAEHDFLGIMKLNKKDKTLSHTGLTLYYDRYNNLILNKDQEYCFVINNENDLFKILRILLLYKNNNRILYEFSRLCQINIYTCDLRPDKPYSIEHIKNRFLDNSRSISFEKVTGINNYLLNIKNRNNISEKLRIKINIGAEDYWDNKQYIDEGIEIEKIKIDYFISLYNEPLKEEKERQ